MATTVTTREQAVSTLGAAFKGLFGAMRRMRGRETRTHDGLSDAQYGLLFGLREQDAIASSELACLAGLSPATATQMLDALASGGLVRRERSSTDRRVVLTTLTDRGHALVEARHAQFAPRWNDALAPFSDEELQTAAAVMDSLHAMFDDICSDA
ncbi:MAG: MarR family transcriptional regulator [Solirubrobacteraceae bacterium]